MANAKSKSQFWTILGAVNLLIIAYPVSMLLGADTQGDMILATVALLGAGLVLGITDVISVLLAYSTSY